MDLEIAQLELRYETLRIRDVAVEARLLSSLSEEGQKSPVLVVAAAEEGRYVLIDGYRRVRALRRLGQDLVRGLVLPGTEAEALVQCHRMDAGRRRCALEEGWLLRALHEEHGFEVRELGDHLGHSKSWVSRRMGLVRALPACIQERVREGTVCAQAAMKSLLPLARANRGHAERLTERVGAARLSSRQYARIYAAWRRADETGKSRIVEDPLLFLKVDEAALDKSDKREKTPLGLLLSDLESAAGLCWRARKRVDEALPRVRISDDAEVRAAWQRVHKACLALGAKLEEKINAGSRHESRDSAAA